MKKSFWMLAVFMSVVCLLMGMQLSNTHAALPDFSKEITSCKSVCSKNVSGDKQALSLCNGTCECTFNKLKNSSHPEQDKARISRINMKLQTPEDMQFLKSLTESCIPNTKMPDSFWTKNIETCTNSCSAKFPGNAQAIAPCKSKCQCALGKIKTSPNPNQGLLRVAKANQPGATHADKMFMYNLMESCRK